MKRGITFIIFLTVIILSFQVVTAKHVWWHFWGGDVQSAPGICRECSLTIRGDANNDCRIDVSDGRYITAWLYSGGTGFCNGGRYYEPADANGDNRVDISDVRYITAWLFNGGPAPKPLSSSTQTSSCKDSDGRDYNNRGIVNITNRTGVFPHIDYCNADGRLVEYSCNTDETLNTQLQTCANGCFDGRCTRIQRAQLHRFRWRKEL